MKAEKQLYDAMGRVAIEYQCAVEKEHIKKPLSYALYQVWKYYDERETKRKCELTETKSERGKE